MAEKFFLEVQQSDIEKDIYKYYTLNLNTFMRLKAPQAFIYKALRSFLNFKKNRTFSIFGFFCKFLSNFFYE